MVYPIDTKCQYLIDALTIYLLSIIKNMIYINIENNKIKKKYFSMHCFLIMKLIVDK